VEVPVVRHLHPPGRGDREPRLDGLVVMLQMIRV
jgi:hypothetical protein